MTLLHDLNRQHIERRARVWPTAEQQRRQQADRDASLACDRVAAIKPEPSEVAKAQALIIANPFPGSGRAILAEVSRRTGVAIDDMRGASRKTQVIEARHLAAYRMAAETKLSLPHIGTLLGKDHTTIINAVKIHAARHGLPLPRCGADVYIEFLTSSGTPRRRTAKVKRLSWRTRTVVDAFRRLGRADMHGVAAAVGMHERGPRCYAGVLTLIFRDLERRSILAAAEDGIWVLVGGAA